MPRARRPRADVAFSHWRTYDAAFPWSGTPTEPDELAQELTTLGVRTAIECDLSNPGAEVWLLDETEARLGPISILVNNAAYSTNDGYERLDAATIDAHYAVNMRARCSWRRSSPAASPRATAEESSTSPPARGSDPCQTSWLRRDEGGYRGVHTQSRPCGRAQRDNGQCGQSRSDRQWLDHPQLRDVLLPRFPMGRLGTPADAARLVAWLASPDAGWVTGQVIHSEGVQPWLAWHRQRCPRMVEIADCVAMTPIFGTCTSGKRTTGKVDSLTGKIALVFPGQGSQFVGMGKALYDASAAARRCSTRPTRSSGFPLPALLSGVLRRARRHHQRATGDPHGQHRGVGSAQERLAEAGQRVDPTVVAGHSLGEFTALVAAGVMDFPSGLQLVQGTWPSHEGGG